MFKALFQVRKFSSKVLPLAVTFFILGNYFLPLFNIVDFSVNAAPNVPTNLGWNTSATHPGNPGYRPVEITCGGYTNQNSVAHNWSDESASGAVSYERQWRAPGSATWSTDPTSYVNPYTSFSSFGGGGGTEGIWNTRVRGYDATGDPSAWSNECQITYDVTAPVVQITSPGDGNVLNGFVDIRGSVTDTNPDHYYLVVRELDNTVIDGPGTVYRYDSFTDELLFTWDTTSVTDGDYIIHLAARDAAGNRDDAAGSLHRITVTVDNTAPPTPSLVWPTDGAVIHPSIAILDWTDETDPHGPVTYNYQSSWSGGSFGPVSTGTNSFINATGSADNTYLWQVQACDSLNNCSAWSGPWEVTIDGTPPYSNFLTPTDNSYHNSPINISGLTADDGSGVDYVDISWTTYNGASCDDLSWAYLTTFDNTDNDTPFNWPESPYAWTPASEGSYCLMAEGTDNAGNLETTAYATNVVYDTTAPLVQITNPSDGDLVNGTVNIQGSVTDDNLWRYWFVVQNSGGTTVAGPGTVYHDGPIVNVNLGWDTTAVPDGDYTIKLEARDKADNKDPIDSVHWITVTVDNTAPPTPSLVWPSDGAVIHPSIAILDWTDETDPHGPVTYNYQSSWSGGSYGPVSTGTNSFINATGSADNTYFWQVQACDSLNNCSAWSSPWEVTIDSTPPYSTFFEPTDNSYHNSPIAISGQTADDGSGVDYVDISWTTYNGASCDDLGWTYLTTFNNTDNDTPFNWPESPYAWTPASEGSYCLMAEGTDNAGNLETTAYATNVVYDTTAPYVEITDPLDGQYVNGTVDIWGFIIDDNLSHYNIAIYPGGVDTWNFSERLEQQTVYTSEFGNSQIYSWDTTIYPDGDYQIRLAARDLAGNRDPMTPSYPNEIGDSVHIITVTVDNTAPTAMFANQSVDETVTSWPGYSLLVSSEPIVNINCSTLETLPRNAETLPNPVAFNCTFEDLAGNLGTSSYTVTVNDIVPSVVVNPSSITVTTADPAVTLTATGSGGNAPLTYSWSGACAGSSSTTTAPSTVGTHVCTVTVTDADGDTASATATVTVNPASTPPAGGQPGTGAGGGTVGTQVTVLGAETGGEGEVNGDAESDEQEEDGEVLGEEECENKSKVRGYIYYDNNDNDQKDKGEEGLESIEVKIYLEKDGEKDVVTTERTDENGYWEAEVCPGEYKAEINKDDLPENVALSSDEVLGLSVKEDEEMNDINFTVKKTQGIDFSWWWCLVPLAIVALVYLASKFFKPKEEQDVKVGM